MKSPESTLIRTEEDDGKSLLTDLLVRSETLSLVHLVHRMVGMDRVMSKCAKKMSDKFATLEVHVYRWK